MADQYTEIKKTGYGSRIVNSFVGILVAIVLIVGSVWVLFSNEGRVDMSKIAGSSLEISSDKAPTDQSLNRRLVSTTGVLSSNQLLGDNLYLKPGRSIVLDRKVEMCSWVEEKASKSKKELGGSETEEITYTYKKKWINDPPDSANFRYPEGHANPERALSDEHLKVEQAKVGLYEIDTGMVNFPALAPVQLNAQKVNLTGGVVLASSRYLFSGKGKINAPEIGDIRISYTALPEGSKVTVFGKLTENAIVPYLDTKNNRLYRMFYGARDEAISAMQGEYKTMGWIMRILGFLMMWIGFTMIFEPLSVLLDILPLLGTVSRFMVGAITFVAALILSIIIVIVSMIVHNIVALLIVLAIVIAAAAWSITQEKKKV